MSAMDGLPAHLFSTRIEYLFQYFDFMSEQELRRELAKENVDTSGTRQQLLKRLRQHYRTALVEIRKKCPYRARTQNFYNYFIVIDFECSCDQNNYDYEHEIIEFPAVLVSVASKKIIDKFHTIVQPTVNPVLTEFCTKLTGITQEQVDAAPKFPEALERFRGWMCKHGLDGEGTGNARRFCYITDGPWDIGKFMQMQCLKSGLAVPHDFRAFMNLRRSFVNFYCHVRPGQEAPKKLPTLELRAMLEHLGMQFEGREHCGMHDAQNIARIVVRMLEDRAELRVNEKLVLGTKLRKWQKLVFDDRTKAPHGLVPASATSVMADPSSSSSSHEEGSSSQTELANAFASKLRIQSGSSVENGAEASATAANGVAKNGGDIINGDGDSNGGDGSGGCVEMMIWKKWWDLLPYKLVKINRVEFLGELHLECESCDEDDDDVEEKKDEEAKKIE